MTDRPDNSKSEMRCQSVQESVLARLDNEPDGAVWSQIEKHLLSCDECAGFAENSIMLNARLREELKDDVNTAGLWSRISVALDAEAQADIVEKPIATRRKIGGDIFSFGTIAAVMLVAVFAYSSTQNSHTQDTPPAVTESINDFLTFKASGREPDINSREPLELRRWLAKRLDFEVPLSSSTPAGFTLVGARLCAFLNRRSVAFMYHMDEKIASVYVMTETGLDTILKRIPNNNELAVFSSRGLTNVVWRSDGLLYVVVADFAENEAVRLARSIGVPGTDVPLKVTSGQEDLFLLAANNMAKEPKG